MKKNELGGLLLRLRKEAGLSQGLLCSGLCSVSRYARIEREELEPDFFLLDRLMGAFGKIRGAAGICNASQRLQDL